MKNLPKILTLGDVYLTATLLLMLSMRSVSRYEKNHHMDHFKVNNEYRAAEAKSLLSNMKRLYLKEQPKRNENIKFENSNKDSCQLSIGIITLSRENDPSEQPHYLLQSVAALIKLINNLDQTKFKIQLSVCNVDHYPEKHIDMHYINEWLTVFQPDAKERKTYKNRYEKELLDYGFCMKHLLQQNSSYVLVLEDDAIAHPELFTVMQRELFENEKCELKREKFYNLFNIKLQTHFWDLNYIRTSGIEVGKILELVSLALCLDMAIVIVCETCTSWHSSCHSSPVLRYVFGTTHELSNAPTGSTVAVLYPRAGAEAAVQYLSSFTCDAQCPIDMVIDKLARKHWKQLLLIDPPLFTHIGYRSTKSQAVF